MISLIPFSIRAEPLSPQRNQILPSSKVSTMRSGNGEASTPATTGMSVERSRSPM